MAKIADKNWKINESTIEILNKHGFNVRYNGCGSNSIYHGEKYLGYLDIDGTMSYLCGPHIEVFNGFDTERFFDFESFNKWYKESSEKFYNGVGNDL